MFAFNTIARKIGSEYGMKRYADSTLMQRTKAELIEMIRDYEHNYNLMLQMNEQQARNFEEILRGMRLGLVEREVQR